MRSMGKGLHKVFSTVVKEISQKLTPLGEFGSEVSHSLTKVFLMHHHIRHDLIQKRW